jgi:hypothetical protein
VPPRVKDELYVGIVVEYQYQGAGIGIVLLVVKILLYPISNQYQNSTCKAAIRNKEITEKNMYFEEHKNSKTRHWCENPISMRGN